MPRKVSPARTCFRISNSLVRHCERSEAIQGYAYDSGWLRGACHRAALRADPLARNDGVCRDTCVQDINFRSRGALRPRDARNLCPSKDRGRRECRMRVAPEAACAAKSTGVSNHRYTASAGIPCAMVLTGSFVLSPVTGLFCHRRPQDAECVFTNLAPASGRQDHTTSPSAATSLVRARIAHDATASIASRSQRP
jgi:hypothetical protein